MNSEVDLPESIIGQDAAFVNVTVLPMDREALLTNHTVIVEDGIISRIGPSEIVSIPDEAILIDGKGEAYLIPGLSDMHIHMSSSLKAIRNDYILYIANGVTTIREMWGGQSDISVSDRDAIAAGEILGPTIYAASPGMDGPGGPWAVFTPPVSSIDQAQELVRDYVSRGYDFIKVYNLLSPDVYQAIVDEAKKHSIPVIGHVPRAVGIEAVFAAGQRSLEHLIGIKLLASNPFTGGNLNMAKVNELVAKAKAAGTWHTPTNTVNSLSATDAQQIRNSPEFSYISPGLRQSFINGFHQGLSSNVASREDANQKTIAKVLYDAGVQLLVGSDSGFGYMIHGFAVHNELESFIEMGLTPYQTLRAATAAAAIFVGAEDEFGIVKEGLRADLILLAGNPLEKFDHLNRDRLGVMVKGDWYSQIKLNSMLKEIADSY
ncbi:amidohydrolase family protein [candidate division KSB1 bacterium]|nr:amidohydrolase family protein [candidate division KSB1 bacterium]